MSPSEERSDAVDFSAADYVITNKVMFGPKSCIRLWRHLAFLGDGFRTGLGEENPIEFTTSTYGVQTLASFRHHSNARSRWIRRTAPHIALMRRSAALYQPNPDDDTICQNVRSLATLVCLVFCFADELGFDLLRALDLYASDVHGENR